MVSSACFKLEFVGRNDCKLDPSIPVSCSPKSLSNLTPLALLSLIESLAIVPLTVLPRTVFCLVVRYFRGGDISPSTPIITVIGAPIRGTISPRAFLLRFSDANKLPLTKLNHIFCRFSELGRTDLHFGTVNCWINQSLCCKTRLRWEETPSRSSGIILNGSVQERFQCGEFSRKRGIEINPYLVQFCDQGNALAAEKLSWKTTPSICILDVLVRGFQKYHLRVPILQKSVLKSIWTRPW